MREVLLSLAPDEESDAEDVERLTRRLRAELRELDVDVLPPPPLGELPPGAKGGDPVTVGAIVVVLSASGGVFTVLIDTLRDWLGRQSARHRISVTIDGDSIELEHATAEERRELIDGFVRRHRAGE
ncbi:effector-associated constant component EACC1 [Streptomyces crystallinus]|uniref:effector-associated constant component EACC1 n=1 Tax=Streptomyces crystallinus TaxID=68191 RepID=UPI0031D26393